MNKQIAIRHFGGVGALATALGISRAAVYQWGERIPDGSAYKIESITGGALRAADDERGSSADASQEASA